MWSTAAVQNFRKGLSLVVTVALCCLALAGCSGDNPVRYDVTVPAAPASVVATPEEGQVMLSWSPSPAAGPVAYRIYYATAPGVTKANGTILNVPGTSRTVSGLANGTTYYFIVTALVAGGESAPSTEVSATPGVAGAFVQQDLTGTWNFSVLIAGDAAGWIRGAISVGSSGAVSYTLYQDSTGGSTPPPALFPALFVDSAGDVRDSATPGFRGVMSLHRTLITGTGPWTGSSRYLAILQKQLPVNFGPADLQGFGSTGGGARRFLYHQISTGTGGEWEWASGQIGRDQKVQYASLTAPSNPQLPGEKASILNISTNGIITESLTGAAGAPAVIMDRIVMSADKTVMVGVASTTQTPKRYVLRIYEILNMIANDPNTFTGSDLAGNYQFHKLLCGTATVTASGELGVDPAGTATFASYADSAAGATPAAFVAATDSDGAVTSTTDVSLHGKLSYYKDLLVMTRSEGSGGYSMTAGVKR